MHADCHSPKLLLYTESAPRESNLILQCDEECMHAKLLQLCLTLCDPMDCSPPGSSIHGFSRQESWSKLPLPSPGDLPNLAIKPRSPALQANSLPTEPLGKPLVLQTSVIDNSKNFEVN